MLTLPHGSLADPLALDAVASHESLRETMLLYRPYRRLEAGQRFGDDVIGVAGTDKSATAVEIDALEN
jgi:hypothetical protein